MSAHIRYYFLLFIGLLATLSLGSTAQSKAAESSPKNEHFVTLQTEGQLGNQLFQIFTAFAYALDSNISLRLPCLRTHKKENMPRNYADYYSHLNLNSEPLKRPPTRIFEEASFGPGYHPIPFYKGHDVQLRGYFQSEKYFGHRRREILETFSPPANIRAKIEAAHPDLVVNAMSTKPSTKTYVGLQFRDYRREQPQGRFHPTMTCGYYSDAVSRFPDSAVFMVATNNRTFIESCLQKFLEPSRYTFLSMSHLLEFFALSMCDSFIIPNSSFGLLASWLSESARRKGVEKVVIAPKLWFTYPFDNHKMTKDLYPVGTIKI